MATTLLEVYIKLPIAAFDIRIDQDVVRGILASELSMNEKGLPGLGLSLRLQPRIRH